MLTSVSSNIADLYKTALTDVMLLGDQTKPRGFNCLELTPYVMTLTDPCKNILNDNVRKINKAFAAAEFMWILTGKQDVESIAKFNSKIAKFSDDGKTFFGAYGPRFAAQIEYVIESLRKDPWTRQAVMTFWRPSPPETKDVPCTVMLHFMRRPIDKLNLTVYMRSNDVWLGLPYDVHNFTCIQIFVAVYLGLLVGTYTHVDGSLHAYEQDFARIRECAGALKPDMYEESSLELLMTEKHNIMEQYLKRKANEHDHKNKG